MMPQFLSVLNAGISSASARATLGEPGRVKGRLPASENAYWI
jgi:hypothetical protein